MTSIEFRNNDSARRVDSDLGNCKLLCLGISQNTPNAFLSFISILCRILKRHGFKYFAIDIPEWTEELVNRLSKQELSLSQFKQHLKSEHQTQKHKFPLDLASTEFCEMLIKAREYGLIIRAVKPCSNEEESKDKIGILLGHPLSKVVYFGPVMQTCVREATQRTNEFESIAENMVSKNFLVYTIAEMTEEHLCVPEKYYELVTQSWPVLHKKDRLLINGVDLNKSPGHGIWIADKYLTAPFSSWNAFFWSKSNDDY